MGKIIRNGVEYGDVSASNISFTPTSGGGLLSDNVQDAITELDTNKVDKENGKGLFSGSYTDLTNKPTIPTNNNQLTNGAGYITSSGSCNYATSAGTATDSTKVAKTGDTMSGTLYFSNYNDVAICLNSSGGGYKTTFSHQNAGQEATVIATKFDATSLIFINGEDSITNHANNRWQSLTPGLQIKKNCVSIGSLIGQGINPSYKLQVNGTTRLYGTVTADNGGMIVKGRAYGSGDDEGIVVLPASNGIAGVVLGSHNARRTQLYLRSSGNPEWVFNNGSTSYILYHPGKSGYAATTADAYYQSGSTFTSAWIILMGAINSGATVIECFLVLAKPITATGMSVSGTIEWVRGNGIAASTKSFYPSTTRIIDSGAGLVQISISTSGFSGASMCAGMASITNFKITFS